jgi:hypothetical protein
VLIRALLKHQHIMDKIKKINRAHHTFSKGGGAEYVSSPKIPMLCGVRFSAETGEGNQVNDGLSGFP